MFLKSLTNIIFWSSFENFAGLSCVPGTSNFASVSPTSSMPMPRTSIGLLCACDRSFWWSECGIFCKCLNWNHFLIFTQITNVPPVGASSVSIVNYPGAVTMPLTFPPVFAQTLHPQPMAAPPSFNFSQVSTQLSTTVVQVRLSTQVQTTFSFLLRGRSLELLRLRRNSTNRTSSVLKKLCGRSAWHAGQRPHKFRIVQKSVWASNGREVRVSTSLETNIIGIKSGDKNLFSWLLYFLHSSPTKTNRTGVHCKDLWRLFIHSPSK